MAKAMRRIEEARNDAWEKWGYQDHDLSIWMVVITEELGEAAQELLHYRMKTGIDGKDSLQKLAFELAQTGAMCVAMMEAVDAEYRKLDGPRIRDFQQTDLADVSTSLVVENGRTPDIKVTIVEQG